VLLEYKTSTGRHKSFCRYRASLLSTCLPCHQRSVLVLSTSKSATFKSSFSHPSIISELSVICTVMPCCTGAHESLERLTERFYSFPKSSVIIFSLWSFSLPLSFDCKPNCRIWLKCVGCSRGYTKGSLDQRYDRSGLWSPGINLGEYQYVSSLLYSHWSVISLVGSLG
jgi:hypothetical protein